MGKQESVRNKGKGINQYAIRNKDLKDYQRSNDDVVRRILNNVPPPKSINLCNLGKNFGNTSTSLSDSLKCLNLDTF